MLRLLLPFLGFTLVYGAAIDPCKDGTRTDGELFLLDDGCHPYYYECVHGESMQRPCAGGTVFDVSIGVCNHPGDTAACGDTSSDPCADGTYTEGTLFLYTEGCFPYYYECVHDQSLQRPCAPGTVFSTSVGVCIHPRDHPACVDGCTHGDLFIPDEGCYSFYFQCVHGEPVEKLCGDGLVFDSTTNTCNWPASVPACVVGSGDCHGHEHEDLYLPDNGCHNYFYQCVHGTAVKMPCPAGLAFNEDTQECDWPSNVPACPGYSPEEKTTSKTTTEADPDNCHGHQHEDLYLPDGGCHDYFYQCVHGTAVKMPCPAGLAFSEDRQICDWPSTVQACPEYPTEEKTTKVTTTTEAAVADPDNCHGHQHEDLYLPDGGCHDYFYQCVHGAAVKMPCPAGLAFSEDRQICDWPATVPACPEYPTEETTTKMTTTTEATADSDNCHGHQHEDLYLPDGGCHDYFYQCVHGTGVKMPCPAGLAFSEERQICDWPSTVPACPEYSTEEKTTKMTTTTEATANSDNCHGHQHEDLYLPDGGCHDYFYQCVHGTGVKMPCPAGLAFSEDRQICDWPSTVPACPEYSTEETTTKLTTTTAASSDSDNCHGHQHEDLYLPDDGCHDYFYQCVHGNAVKMPCPAGLAFSEERQICDWPSTVPACPEYSTEEKTTKMTTTTEAAANSDNCHGHQHEDLYLPDGGCHAYFYQCVHGTGVKMPCPAGLAFSEERQICDWPSTVPACPEYSTEEKTTKSTTTTEAAANSDNCHGHQHEDLYLPDGGCHDYFYQCVHGTGVKMPCPAGLAFSEERQICDWPPTVPACPEYSTDEKTTKMTTTTEAAANSDNCHGHQHEDLYLPDGGCLDYFYQCVHGTGVKMPCPAGLAFSEDRQICDWPSTVPACPEYSTEETTTKLTTTTAASSDSDNCHGHQHEDLYLPDDGCHDYFYQCVHGEAVKMPCPAGLAFSEERQICDWPSTVPACPEYSTEEKTTKSTTTTEAAANSDNCHGHQHEDLYLPDGGCHDYFYQCVHGTGVKMPCPAGLAFSEERQICDWPSTVPACPEYSTEEKTTKMTTTTEAAANSDNCHGHQHEDLYLPDGGCHDYFYQCVHGTGVKMPCPAGLVFSEERQICDWPSTVPACPEYSSEEKTTKMTTTTAASDSDNCHGHEHEDLYLPDGGCHDYFYQCVHGTAVKMPCPAGLAFSEERQICDWPSTVPACPEYSNNKTTTAKTTTTTESPSDSGDKSTTTLNTTTISSDKTTTTLTTTTQGASDKNTTTESGTDSKGKSYVGFVVDVTGSMKKEIDAVKQWMTDCIDGKSSTCGKEPSGGWIVSSFNDPDAELEIGPTTNISRAISAVASLTPKGGWDCPEMAFLGLSKAIEAVPEDNDGCKMFFFSDATPKDVHRALGVIKSFIKKRCIFIPILTGCCGECHPVCPAVDEEYCIDHVTSTYHSRRRRDIEISESAPSEYSYYTMAEETGGNVYITDKPESADDFFEYLSDTVTLGTCGSTKTAGPDGGYKCEADCVASSLCWDRSVSKCFCSDDKCSTETPLIGASACGGAQHFPCDADIPRQIFPDSKLCNGFYMCEYARLHHFVCAPGAIYSATSTSYCDHPYNVPEPCGTLKSSDEETIY
ncbi:uncharacterized protein LOC120329598 isoform X2 [Styela clava]